MRKSVISVLSLSACVLFSSCNGTDSVTERNLFTVFPDYTDVTIPYNIAPLNFDFNGEKSIRVEIKGVQTGFSKKYRGGRVRFSLGRWKRILEAEKGNTVSVTITGRNQKVLKSFNWEISEYPIDPYLSYRLIEPSYETWNDIVVVERNVENFNTRLLSNNNLTDRSCMNCHISNGTNSSFFHVRGPKGGTVVNRNGKITKLNTRNDSVLTTAAYGAMSADGRYGVFTAAQIFMFDRSHRTKRVEVYDTNSDLVVVDFDKETITDCPAVKGEEYQETFPCFSADGRTIYFCRALHKEQPEYTKQMHYSLCSIGFDPETGMMDNNVAVLADAESLNTSFNQPRVSPDGRFLVASMSDFGTFPIWHDECDLVLFNLETGEMSPLAMTNSSNSESHHSWSGNSHWLVFASKRGDKVFGRIYIAYIDDKGEGHKAFVLPQKNPNVYNITLKSYNMPEIYATPEPYGARDIETYYKDVKSSNLTYLPYISK